MSHRYANIALVILIAIFVLGVFDAVIPPYYTIIPKPFVSIATAVLSGVAIGAILRGLAKANGDNQHITNPDNDEG